MNPRSFLRFLAYAALLHASFAHNALGIPDSVESSGAELRSRYLGYDSALVMNRMARGCSDAGGLILWDEARGEHPYRSQYGLQGEVLARLWRITGNVTAAAANAAVLLAALTAISLAAFFVSLGGRIGTGAADLAVALTAATPCFLPLAPSLYWAPFLLFAPFLAVWFSYPGACRSLGRFALLLGGVATLVGVKCLSGYEHVSTAIVAPIAAAAYHAAAIGQGVRAWLMRSAAIGLAGAIGFAAALTIHARHLETTTGQDGWAAIRQRAEQRTGTDIGGEIGYHLLAPEPSILPAKLRTPVRCFCNYFWLPALASPRYWSPLAGELNLGRVVLLAVLLASLGWFSRQRWPRDTLALIPAGFIGLVAALSWQAFAINHMAVHIHINVIVFAVPFLLFAYAGFGCAVQAGFTRLGINPRWLGWFVFAGIALTIGMNAFRSRGEPEANREAGKAVEAVLLGERSAGPPISWNVNSVRKLPAEPWGVVDGAESDPRLSPAARGAGKPCWLVNLVAAMPGRGNQQPMRMVAIRDGRAVPVRFACRRLSLVERSLGGRSTWIGATVIVDAIAPPRLFLVAGRNCESVSEVFFTAPRDQSR